MTGLKSALSTAALLASISTLGDVASAFWSAAHPAGFAFSRCVFLSAAMGLRLGLVRRQPTLGVLGGFSIGLGGGLAQWMFLRQDYVSVVPPAVALWIAFALLDALALQMFSSVTVALARGVMAAFASGALYIFILTAFGIPRPGYQDPVRDFLAWLLVGLPGCIALLCGVRRRRRRDAFGEWRLPPA